MEQIARYHLTPTYNSIVVSPIVINISGKINAVNPWRFFINFPLKKLF